MLKRRYTKDKIYTPEIERMLIEKQREAKEKGLDMKAFWNQMAEEVGAKNGQAVYAKWYSLIQKQKKEENPIEIVDGDKIDNNINEESQSSEGDLTKVSIPEGIDSVVEKIQKLVEERDYYKNLAGEAEYWKNKYQSVENFIKGLK